MASNSTKFFNAWYYITKYKGFGWFLFWGQRSNGKTFSTLDGSMVRGLKIAYIRRYDTDLTNADLQKLFYTDHNIKGITNGEYDNICVKSGKQICYCKYDDNGKIEKCSTPFAQCFALNKWERYKGADRGNFDIIVFDEFMTDRELQDEYISLKNMLSTLLRNRENSTIVMLANSFNPFSVYFDELCVNDIVQSMGRGDTRTAKFEDTQILLHYCSQSSVTAKVNSRFFGFDKNKQKTQMIESGSWQIDDYPHCTLPYIHRHIDEGGNVIAFLYLAFRSKFMVFKIVYVDRVPLFIHAHFTKEIPNNARFIFTPLSDIYADNIYHSIKNFETRNPKIGELFEKCLRAGRIYFNTNLEGEFFKTWYDKQKFREFTF